MAITLTTRDPGFEAAFRALLAAKRESAADVDDAVRAIIDDVATRGDAALVAYTNRFDRVRLSPDHLRLSHAEIAAGAERAPAETVAALRVAAERIESFHRRQLPAGIDYVDAIGVRLGQRWRPIAAVGLYVPGGTAAYPSSVLMNAIPAKVAGVERLVMTVPAPDGILNPLVLAPPIWSGLTRSIASAGRRPLRPSPTAPRRLPRSTRSSGRATPMSRRPSGASSAGSGST